MIYIIKHKWSILLLGTISVLLHFYFLWNRIPFAFSGGDPVDQFLKFQWFLHESIRAGNFEWSWLYGLGGDIFGEFGYYYMTSPFFWLTIPFEFNDLYDVVKLKLVISVLKVFLAGLFTYFYLIYVHRSTYASLFGAFLYIGSVFFIQTSYYNDYMSDSFVFLPIVLISLERALRHHKYGMFILGIFLIIQSNFYFAFITTIYLMVYVMVWFFVNEKIQIKSFFKFAIPIIISYLLGVGLASYSFLPVIFQYFDAYRFSKVHTIPTLFSTYFYQNFVTSLFFHLTYITFPAIALLILLLGVRWKHRLLQFPIVMAIVLTIFYAVPYMYSVFNGFSAIQTRWLYLFIFAISTLTAFAADEVWQKKRLTWVSILGYYLFVVISLFHSDIRDMLHESDLFKMVYIMHIILPFVLLRKRIVILGIIVQLLTINLLYFPDLFGEKEQLIRNTKHALNYSIHPDKVPAAEYIKEVDNTFYRTQWYIPHEYLENRFSLHNDNMLYELPSLSTYQSLLSQQIGQFIYEDYQIRQFDSFSHFYNVDERPVLQSYLQAKYLLKPGGLPYEPKGYELLEVLDPTKIYTLKNPTAFGFVEKNRVSRTDFEKLNAAEREELLLKAYVSEEETTNFDIQSNLDSELLFSEGFQKLKLNKPTTMTIPLPKLPSNDEEWLFEIGIEEVNGKSFKITVDNKTLLKREEAHTYSLPNKEFVLHLDDVYEKQEVSLTLTEGDFNINYIRISVIPLDVIEQHNEQYSNQTYNVVKWNKNKMILKGSNENSGMLITSIPYSPGWKAKIDGEKLEVEVINRAFVGVKIPEGENTIELTYHSPYLRTGLLISFLSIFIVLVFRKFMKLITVLKQSNLT